MIRKKKPQKRKVNYKEHRPHKQRVREWFDDNEQIFNDYKQGKIY